MKVVGFTQNSSKINPVTEIQVYGCHADVAALALELASKLTTNRRIISLWVLHNLSMLSRSVAKSRHHHQETKHGCLALPVAINPQPQKDCKECGKNL